MAERKMATSIDIAEQLFAREFGRAPSTPEERKFLRGASQRKQGPALLGAIQSAKQRGQFAPNNPQQDPGSALEQALQQTQSAIMQANRDIQKAKQNQFTEELRLNLKKDLIKPLEGLLQERGRQRAQIQEFDTSIEGNELETGSQLASLRQTDLANRLQALSDISGAVRLRESGLGDILDRVQRNRQQELQAAQAGLEGATTQLGALGDIQAIRQQQELFPLQKARLQADIGRLGRSNRGTEGGVSTLQDLPGQQEPQTQQSFDEFLAQRQEEAGMTFTPETKEQLRQEFEQQNRSRQTLISEFQQAAIASDKSEDQIERAEQAFTNFMLNNNTVGAQNIIDTLTGEGERDPIEDNIIRAGRTVVRDATEALNLMKQSQNFFVDEQAFNQNEPIEGVGPALERVARARIPGTKEYEIRQLIESVKANIGIDTLLNIKREGAGLGQVPQRQLETLQSVLGQLTVGRRPDLLKRDLQQVKTLYRGIVREAGGDIGDITGSTSNKTQGFSGQTSSGINYTVMP